jgi:hypothetical protein
VDGQIAKARRELEQALLSHDESLRNLARKALSELP